MALPRRQRVAAYAVIVRDERILLSRLAPWITSNEQWTLPGGGIDHGEDPRHAVVREILEETGLEAVVGEQARVYSAHQARVRRDGRRSDYHALRIVYDGWVPPDAPEPRVVEVDGSTVDSAWHSLGDVLDGTVPTVPMVQQALADWSPFRMQRVGAYALVRRGDPGADEVLLVRFSVKGFHTGSWSLPGGGIDHGERPAGALVREVRGGVRGGRRGRRAAAGARRALQRDRAVRPLRGLPLRRPGVRRDRARRRASRGWSRSVAPPTRSSGYRCARSPAGPGRCSTSSMRRWPQPARKLAGEPPPPTPDHPGGAGGTPAHRRRRRSVEVI